MEPDDHDSASKPASLAASVGKSPKLAKKVIRELDRQPNGSFVAAAAGEEDGGVAGGRRGAGKKAGATLEVPTDAQVSWVELTLGFSGLLLIVEVSCFCRGR